MFLIILILLLNLNFLLINKEIKNLLEKNNKICEVILNVGILMTNGKIN